MRLEMDAGRGRVIYSSYISVIERHFLPYFGERHLETLTATDIAQAVTLSLVRAESCR
ncbi:MAG: hypothetical protein FJ184_03775 [Gammaproteobacteria bacterium]|nr:hypothetical protein [Gammaproteobacteria bacterium]